MSTAAKLPSPQIGYATTVRCDGASLWVTLSTGRVVRESVKKYDWLSSASLAARRNVEVVAFGTVVRWPDIDEELGVNTILGVSEETIARLAGFTMHASRPAT